MKRKPWTNHEVEFITEWWGKRSARELAGEMGRTTAQVLLAGQRYGLSNKCKHYRHKADIDPKRLGLLIAKGIALMMRQKYLVYLSQQC